MAECEGHLISQFLYMLMWCRAGEQGRAASGDCAGKERATLAHIAVWALRSDRGFASHIVRQTGVKLDDLNPPLILGRPSSAF